MERRQAGFSLIELVIAMVVTLIVSGAIYELMTAGSTAFRREPEMADRQQNARVAMDLVSQDVFGAGFGIPQYVPVFTTGLNNIGPPGSGGGGNPGGPRTDEIEMVSTSECGALKVCRQQGVNLVTTTPLGSCMNFPAPILLACNSGPSCPNFGIYWAEEPSSGGGGTSSCSGAAGKTGLLTMPPGQDPILNPPGGPGFDPQYLATARLIRYRVNMPPPEGVPVLERSTLGGQPNLDGSPSWVVISRGIEDLQIQYLVGGAWINSAPAAIALNDPTTLVSRVRITVSARALDAANVVGQTTSAVGNAIRGQLISEITPRPAMTTAAMMRGEM